jgi:hypothetical protein
LPGDPSIARNRASWHNSKRLITNRTVRASSVLSFRVRLFGLDRIFNKYSTKYALQKDEPVFASTIIHIL